MHFSSIACFAVSSLVLTAQAMPPDLVRDAQVSATSMASPTADGKYGVERLRDGSNGTKWASANFAKMPQMVTMTWPEPVTLDTVKVDIFSAQMGNLYALWKTVELRLSDGASVTCEPRKDQTFLLVRFDTPHRVSQLDLVITAVYEPKHYIGICELGVYHDPHKRIREPKQIVKAKATNTIEPRGRPHHPTVYITPEDVARARRNAQATEWGKAERALILKQADVWLEHDDDYWLQFLPEPGACYAYGFTGCPICSAACGTWGGARCSWDRPRTLRCTNGHALPDPEHPDTGAGYRGDDGRFHYIVGSWNAWVTEQWTRKATPALAHAYALTADEKYAERAAFFLDAMASIYAESTSGSWDYPSRPPSGRFARPWYQVARNLVVYVEAYDLIYSSVTLGKPSLRPAIEKRASPEPTLQKRAVGTADAAGRSWPGMTRRENIDLNLMQDGAAYCYKHTFKGILHNGHADYMRGALAVGALLGIPEYVENAVSSPYSIYAMLANNCDRDGRYYETALGYALHARNLYLTFVEPLRNWRSEARPDGVDIFTDPRMLSFFYLPDLVMECAGHSPNFGDCGPDNNFRLPKNIPYSPTDYSYAEWLYRGCAGLAKEEFGKILSWLANGDISKARKGARHKRWLLYNADPVPGTVGAALPADLRKRLFGSWLLGQKGIGILRDGEGVEAQAALLRFGPSLNHGDRDDLGLIYYGKGWQLTYEIGYGLGSTHTQVGWGSQTASHTLVAVNEASQRGGSGGSATLFAALPSVKIMAADSPLSYASQNVTQYHRTVALIGQGADQYLVDVFRVRGGKQHDYIVGVQTQDVETEGIDLGLEEEGSLAGLEHAWGERQGHDGDIKGFPNKPYWNPPPGTGYGFFYDARRGEATSAFRLDFSITGRNHAHFRIHCLPEPGTTAIVAKAPGLYPRHRKATYLIARRQGDKEGLESVFAAVMEPYAGTLPAKGIPSHVLLGSVIDYKPEIKHLGGLDIVLLKGTAPGDFMTFEVGVAETGDYEVVAYILNASSYGTVVVSLDGSQLGDPVVATSDGIRGPVGVSFGRRRLTAGKHQMTFRMAESAAYYVGVSSILLTPWSKRQEAGSTAPTPILSAAERVPVTGPPAEIAPVGVYVRRDGRDEYTFSTELSDAQWTAATKAGTLQWRGAFVFLAVRDGVLETVATHGAWDVRLAGKAIGPEVGLLRGNVTALDDPARWIEIDVALPEGANAPCVYLNNPGYSRQTAYRIYGTAPTRTGCRIDLGPQPMLLGQGRVHQIPSDNLIETDIPHEYCRSVVGGTNTGFFNGKLMMNGKGAQTKVTEAIHGQPMKLHVKSTDGFAEGDPLFYYDVQLGDAVTIPTAWEKKGK